MALKCADLGHLASPRVVHKKWVQHLEEEFFRQGDREKQNGLTVSPLMDRDKNGITKSQVGVLARPRVAALFGEEVAARGQGGKGRSRGATGGSGLGAGQGGGLG